MTSVFVWTPDRYPLKNFDTIIRQLPLFQDHPLGPIYVKTHDCLSKSLLHKISSEIASVSHLSNIHVIIFDDVDLNLVLDKWQVPLFMNNLFNISQVFTTTSFVICDLVDYTRETPDARDIRHMRFRISQTFKVDNNNVYGPHHYNLPGRSFDQNKNITESGQESIIKLIARDLAELPLRRF